MDAGVCTACQNPLGHVDLEGMLGLFPRVRCAACGLVNVLLDGAVAAASPAAYEEPSVEMAASPEYEQGGEYNEPTRTGIGISSEDE